MLLIIVATLTIVINTTAFFIKDTIKGLILFGVSIAAWLILTFLLVLNAIQSYPGSFVSTAAGLFGLTMVIINTIMIVIPLVGKQRSTYDDEQTAIKSKIYKITHRNEKKWFD